MMKRQARWSGLVMGFDTRMIAGSCACSTFTRPTRPNITNQSSPYYAEALVGAPAGSASAKAPRYRQSGNVASPTPATGSKVPPEPSARITPSPRGVAKTT
jgi:hypothetical protein